MSTLTEIKELLKQYLGFHDNLDDAIISAHLNLVQARLERPGILLPWFLFSDDATITTGVDYPGTRKVNLPENFIDFDEEWDLVVLVDGKPYGKVKKLEYYEVDDNQSDTGVPEVYVLEADALHLFPLPDIAYTINFPHYAKSEGFSVTEANPWFIWFPDLVIAMTLISLAAALRDKDAGNIGMNLLRDARADFMRTVEGRKARQQNYTPEPM